MFKETRDAHNGEVEMVLNLLNKNFKRFDSNNFRVSPAPCCKHDPKINTPAFNISIDKGLWFCYACGRKGNWITFCRLVNYKLGDSIVTRFVENYNDDWFQVMGIKQVTPVTSGKYPELLEYCNSRGISNETLNDFRVVSCGSESIEIPMFTWHEERWKKVSSRIVGVLGESKGKQRFGIKGGPTHLLIGNHLLNPCHEDKRIFIFEGQWDVMTAYEIGLRNVFSLPNGASNIACASMLQYIPDDFEIFICTDMDEAGNNAAIKFFSQIGPERFRRLMLPKKDLNDWFLENPDLTVEEILQTASGLNFGSVENKNDEIESLDFMSGELEEDVPLAKTPWEGLNEYLDGGFFEGQITSLLAQTGCGKTTVVNHIAMFAAKENVKVGLISLEDTPHKLKRKLRQVAESLKLKTVETLMVTQLEGQHTKHNDLIICVDKLIKSGHKLIIVDNVNHISGTINQQLDTFRAIMNLIIAQNCHAILVVQPNKIDASKNKVNSGDMKGFSEIIQGVWNHINICKDDHEDDVRYLHVEKCRNNGPGSRAFCYIRYDNQKNLYTETSTLKLKMPVKLLRKN